MIYTYLITDNKYFKIGKSINPEKRLKTLKTANPNVRLIAYGNGISENYLHRRFKENKFKGEWYRLNELQVVEIVDLIKPINNVNRKNLKNSIRRRKIEERIFNKNKTFIIKFGKYNGTRLIDMNSNEELNYLKWCVKTFEYNESVKMFRWWLTEHGILPKKRTKIKRFKNT